MNSEVFQLVQLSETDVHSLRHVSIKTFQESFSEDNTEEDMQLYINQNLSIEKLSTELMHKHSEFYGIKDANQLIAYLKLNTEHAQTEIFSNALEIERIYVLKEFQGKKIGQALMELSLQKASQYACDFIWLGVWEHNHKAISFYKKNGFIPFDTHVFTLGKDQQTDILMKLLVI